jgi:hypothetical protein
VGSLAPALVLADLDVPPACRLCCPARPRRVPSVFATTVGVLGRGYISSLVVRVKIDRR